MPCGQHCIQASASHPSPAPSHRSEGFALEVLSSPPWHASTPVMGLEGSDSPNSWFLFAPMVIQHQAFSLQTGSKAAAALLPMGMYWTSPMCPMLCLLLLWDRGSACGLAVLHMWLMLAISVCSCSSGTDLERCSYPKTLFHEGVTKLHLSILPSLRSLYRCFPSCRKSQILDCPGQDRCSALGLWHPLKGGTGGSS